MHDDAYRQNFQVSTDVTFFEEQTSVGGQTPFQLRITTPLSTCLHLLPTAFLRIYFSDNREPIILNRIAADEDSPSISLGDVGDGQGEAVQREGGLKFNPGGTQVLYGTVYSLSAIELKVTSIDAKAKRSTNRSRSRGLH